MKTVLFSIITPWGFYLWFWGTEFDNYIIRSLCCSSGTEHVNNSRIKYPVKTNFKVEASWLRLQITRK
jgi:hypothetical protein